jgi:uncharacterized membrane protein YhaH (DUF805 family)
MRLIDQRKKAIWLLLSFPASVGVLRLKIPIPVSFYNETTVSASVVSILFRTGNHPHRNHAGPFSMW